ncbi:MAG: hypothetical protein KF883_16470 [Thermomicrobiales bacterium]|nr:hypothetical protein [Thermomicrobiales bacterium]
MTDESHENETEIDGDEEIDRPAPLDDEETAGVGSALAIGCTLIVLLITLGGVCYFVAQRVT